MPAATQASEGGATGRASSPDHFARITERAATAAVEAFFAADPAGRQHRPPESPARRACEARAAARAGFLGYASASQRSQVVR